MTQPTEELRVLQSLASVSAVLSPIRLRLLENLGEPDSAAGLARRLDLPRQKVNYHLRTLEREGLVELVEERQRRGCVERRLRNSARALVVSPTLLGRLAETPERARDRFSSAFLVERAARLVHEVAVLRERAAAVDQTLATFTLESELSFESPSAFKSFADELALELARLAARYDQPDRGASRRYRFVVGAHPAITKTPDVAAAEAAEHGKETS